MDNGVIYDRSAKKVYEEQPVKPKSTDFLYKTAIGGAFRLLLRLPIISAVYGAAQRSRRSARKIKDFAENYGINLDDYESGYESFNDFFIRKPRKTDFVRDAGTLISPADSVVTACRIQRGQKFEIKGRGYSLASFLKDANLAKSFEGGWMLIFRLRVYDCHRYCFFDGGRAIWTKTIRGVLDSVNSSATGRFTLNSNYREISLLRSDHFGDAVFAEVGAMFVGAVVNTHKGERFEKGDEKGYFEFGGSTVVVLIKEGLINIDADIADYSKRGIESHVSRGEKIGSLQQNGVLHL
jgi:phosphatidylserine decarboxylase